MTSVWIILTKPWRALLGAFLETKWWVLNSLYGQQLEAITFTKTSGRRQSGKSLPATKNTTGMLELCTEMETQTMHLGTFQEHHSTAETIGLTG